MPRSSQALRDVMSTKVHSVLRTVSLRDVAAMMKSHDIGDVIVVEETGKLYGILTDRDLVIRAMAEARDPDKTRAGDICSTQAIATLPPEAPVEDAVKVMRERAVRRIPIVQDGTPVGIVSIGDLAQLKDPNSALGTISSAPSNT